VITAPQSEEAIQKWVMAGDKQYQKYLTFVGKTADWSGFIDWKERRRKRKKGS
jgi:hypothetical protein